MAKPSLFSKKDKSPSIFRNLQALPTCGESSGFVQRWRALRTHHSRRIGWWSSGAEIVYVHPFFSAGGMVCHNSRVKWFSKGPWFNQNNPTPWELRHLLKPGGFFSTKNVIFLTGGEAYPTVVSCCQVPTWLLGECWMERVGWSSIHDASFKKSSLSRVTPIIWVFECFRFISWNTATPISQTLMKHLPNYDGFKMKHRMFQRHC